MRTRRGLCYPKLTHSSTTAITTTTLPFPSHNKKKRNQDNNTDKTLFPVKLRELGYLQNNYNKAEKVDTALPCRKRAKVVVPSEIYDGKGPDFLDTLPDDIVISILAKLSHSASCPADFINALLTCKRLKGLAMSSIVLSKATPKIYSIKAEKWCESAHKFLKFCSDSGNVDASYTLGMIRFYCLENRGSGASLMAKAAINSHAQALYSLAVIQFNGSGGTKTDKDLRAGVALCARAAFLGHVDSLRELGHCLQDGYGVRQNISEGRRFLVMANAREVSSSLTCPQNWSSMKLLSDFGCDVVGEVVGHPVNGFMREWFESGRVNIESGLRMCSYEGCGRAETRKHEFRRCSVCGVVNYCSRACQALDWKVRHKCDCTPMARWDGVEFDGVVGDGVVNGMDAMEVDEVQGGET